MLLLNTDALNNLNETKPNVYQIAYDCPDRSTIVQTEDGLKQYQFLKSWASGTIRETLRAYLLSHEATSPQKSIFITHSLETITGFRELEANLKQVIIQDTELKLFTAQKKKQELRIVKLKQKIDWLKAHWEEVTPKIEYHKIEELV